MPWRRILREAQKKPTTRRSANATTQNRDRQKSKSQADLTAKARILGLSEIRRFLEVRNEFAALLGQLATFRIVIDANIFIRELLWISTKRKNQNAKPELLERLEAGTIVAHVTPRILEEVEKTMATLAVERGFQKRLGGLHGRSICRC